jgi:ribosome maturation factor RimP
MQKVEDTSKAISKFLDGIDLKEEHYFLDIYSSGTEKEIHLEKIENHLNQNIKVELSKPQNDSVIFEGVLYGVNTEHLNLKVNQKGAIRKIIIDKSNIKYMNLSTKINKKGKNEKK